MNRESEKIDIQVNLIQDAFSEFTVDPNTGNSANHYVTAKDIREWLVKRYQERLNEEHEAFLKEREFQCTPTPEERENHWDDLEMERRLESREESNASTT